MIKMLIIVFALALCSAIVQAQPTTRLEELGHIKAGVQPAPTVVKFTPEEEALFKAFTNFKRAECLRWAIDQKAKADAKVGKIQDWGNVRTQPVCEDYIYKAPVKTKK